MIDHLIDGSNLRAAGIALIVGLALAALVSMISGCSPQQSSQLYPLMGVVSQVEGMGSQAASLYQMQQQAEFQREQQQLQLDQLRQQPTSSE
jgi:hypothetical protein